jgi:Mechanosensitive ion channel, conserved TM helix
MQIPTSGTQTPATGALAGFQNEVIKYLPTFAAGLLVLALGVLAGWVAKRAVIRALIWLRLDRLGGRRAWRAAFRKGDVRSALYNLVGNVAMVLVILIFVDNATQIWRLAVVGRLIDGVLVQLPNLALVALIVGVGLLLSNSVAGRIEDALEEEDLAHPRLIAKGIKGALLSIVGALALWQLNFARQIVLSAFLIAFGAIGVAFTLAVGLGAAKAVQRGLEGMFERKKE